LKSTKGVRMQGPLWTDLSGVGLFLTYPGFNLLYSRYGASQYVLYAVLSIITTTIIVGIWWLKEPVRRLCSSRLASQRLNARLDRIGFSRR